MSRVAIFIDGGYLAELLKEFGKEEVSSHGATVRRPAKINFDKLAKEIARQIGNVEVLRTYYYDCLPYKPYESNLPTELTVEEVLSKIPEEERFSKKQHFFSKLRRLPRFEVREGRLAFRGRTEDGKPIFEQKRVDTLLTLDLALLSAKGEIKHAVLLTGDSDFIPVIKAVQSEGVLVWLYHGSSPHTDLWEAADERFHITKDFIDHIRMSP